MATLKRIVDAHIHLWQLSLGWYPQLEGDPSESREDTEHGTGDFSKLVGHDYRLKDYFADAAPWPVEKVVHVTAAQTPPRWSDETAWLQKMRETEGNPMGIVAWIDLSQDAAAVKAEVREHQAFAGFRGFRNHEGVDYRSDHVGDVFEVFAELGVLYDLVAHEDQHGDAAAIARRLPQMQFVVEHSGWPTGSDKQTFAAWRTGIRELAGCPNVACKLSGLGMVMHQWTAEDFRPWVLEMVEAFGPSRCIFATNFPVDGLYSTYSQLVEAYLEILKDHSQADHDEIFAGAAERIYRI